MHTPLRCRCPAHRRRSQVHGEGAAEPWPLDDARDELGLIADALAMDQQASSERARDLLGWRPQRPPVLTALRNRMGTKR